MSKQTIVAVYPLSPMQEGMLYHYLSDQSSESYFEQFSLQVQGQLEIAHLEAAFNHVIAQNEALRTVIRWNEVEKPVQIVLSHREEKIRFVDLGHLSGDQLIETVRQVKDEERCRGFDLERGPLLRLTVCQLSRELYEIIWSYHHIIMDGWSSGIIWKELFAVYRELEKGRPLLPQKKSSMKAYLKFLQEYDRDQAATYWQQYLEGFTDPTGLPRDFVADDRVEIAKVQGSLEPEWSARLAEFCRREKVTVNLVVQMAWGLLLQHYNDVDDVLFGATIAGRPYQLPQMQEMVGLFINTVPVRLKVSEEQQVSALLQQLKTESFQRSRFEYSSLVEINAQSDVGPGEQLFDHVLVFEGLPVGNFGHTDMGLTLVSSDQEMRTNFDLTVIAALNECLTLELLYNTHTFRQNTLLRVMGHFWNLVKGIIGKENCRVAELEILDPEEKMQVLHTFNNTGVSDLLKQTVHQMVEEQVERTPDHAALYFAGNTLTYREMNHRANRLARLFRTYGVGRNTLVGVMVERSFEMVITLLGILKAGGAYLPLDPLYPEERLSYMLEDAQVALLVTQAPLLAQIPATYQGEVLMLGSEGQALTFANGSNHKRRMPDMAEIEAMYGEEKDLFSDENLEPVNSPDDRVYVIYTSGSTGKPKGVILQHKNLLNLLQFEHAETNIDFSGKMLQFTSLSFDVSFQEIFSPLTAGGSVYLIPDEERKDLQQMLRFLGEHQIEIISFPFSYLNILFEEQENVEQLPESLQHIITAGEQLIITDPLRDYLKTHSVSLHNHYGPSETHVVTTLTLDGTMDLPRIPGIGRPVSNTAIYILDRKGQPQPIGIPGEIYIAGTNVGAGYLHRPDLTAERYLPNPFGSDRMYRTGDLGRWLPDGTIEFLGRMDSQVKIRGFRVELGEVESALLNHSAVKQVVVVDKIGSDKRKFLVAYIVTESPQDVSTELRCYLTDQLPEYMVPSTFVFLDTLPLTPSGKVNRKALPDVEAAGRAGEYVAPRTELERSLAQIWAEVLGFEQVGIHDSFFVLGGHSLKATQVVSRIQKVLGRQIPLKTFLTAQTIARLSELLAEGEQVTYEEIPAQPAGSYYPLSHAQRRLWVIYQMEENNNAYNMPSAFLLKGSLDVSAFTQAFQTIVERHEILRTRFDIIDGIPVQIVEDSRPVKMPYLDWEQECYAEGDLQALINAEAAKPFDLTKPGLIRSALIRLGETEHVFLFTMHHIISDGWSNDILVREIAQLYTAYREGHPNPLPALKIQYRDYAHWQNSKLTSDQLREQEAYWLTEFAEEMPVLNLPTDYQRPALQSFAGANYSFTLDRGLTSQLKQFAEEQGVTLFMTLFAAYNALCYRYTGSEEMITGTPVAGRQHPDLEGLIGFFVNTLALRTHCKGTDSFQRLLHHVKEVALNGFANQAYPFDLLVDQLHLERDLSRSPLFDTMFNFLNTGDANADVTLPGLTIASANQEIMTSRFDQLWTLQESRGIIYGNIEYCTALFKLETIERMVGHFRRLLTEVMRNPDVELDEIQLISPEEERQVLYGFNPLQEPSTYAGGTSVHQLFEEQVRRTPDQIALHFGDKSLTYDHLNKKANRLARLLRAKGVRPDTLVGIMIDRSLEMVIGLLAVLKAGGAYLPLDPLYPEERIRYMLQDANVPLLLTQPRFIEQIPTEYTGEIMDIDLWLEFLEAKAAYPSVKDTTTAAQTTVCTDQSCFHCNSTKTGDLPHTCVFTNIDVTNNLENVNTPDDLVYVIYTSGSTGKPKGVQLEHANLVNLLDYSVHQTGIDYQGRMLQFTSLSFDVSFQEIFTPLSAGGTVCLISDEKRKDPGELFHYLNQQQIEIISLPFSYLNVLFEEQANLVKFPASLKQIITAGEQLIITDTLREYLAKHQVRLHNQYGPSETHVATALTLRGDSELPRVPGIGRPIKNFRIYILDRKQQPVPIGVPGEIYIGGAGVGRGYLHRPELTTERFLPDPFILGQDIEPAENSRIGLVTEGGSLRKAELPWQHSNRIVHIYKTGDAGLWLPDGTIKFLGRLDDQVKIRGFRVEIGEVEASLLTHSKIQKVVVIAKKDSTQRKSLVAYLVSEPGLQVGEIRQYLLQRLPDYMVPTAYVLLETIPLTPSGKVDRRALPEPDLAGMAGREYIAPRNRTEAVMAQIWAEVLGVERVGIQDHFFELGGHSLKATQIISRLTEQLELKVPLRLFFTTPTIGEMVERLGLHSKAGYREIPIQSLQTYYPLSHAQRRLWLINQLEESNIAYNMPTVFRIRGELNVRAFRQAFQTVVDRHEILRTGFVLKDGEPVQVIEDCLTFEIPDLTWQSGDIRERIHAEVMKPFDLTHPGLLRAILVQMSEEEYVFLFVIHHIISDGWSNDVLVRELATLYTAYCVGERNPLPPLKLQYRDYAVWQNQLLDSPEIQTQEEYWLEQLHGELPVLNLPCDVKRPPIQTFRGDGVGMVVGKERSVKLYQLAQTQGVSLFITLFAAYNLFLHHYTGQKDLIVGTPVAGRKHRDLEDLIGFFVNTLALRTRLTGEESFLELLAQTKEMVWNGFENQDYPFDLLVNRLQLEREMSRSAVFDTMFTLQAGKASSLKFGSLQLEPVDSEFKVSRYDLILTLVDDGDILSGGFNYNTDLFKQKTVERMAEHFLQLLDSMLAHPEMPIAELEMISAREKELLLYAWNATSRPEFREKSLQAQFEEQVAAAPEQIAVRVGEQELTYGELNAEANQLAAQLRSLSTLPDQPVGVLVNRSLEMIIALVGIMKAGGAFVPMDPSQPVERNAFILQDADVKVCVLQSALQKLLPPTYSGDLVEIRRVIMGSDTVRCTNLQQIAEFTIVETVSANQPRENIGDMLNPPVLTGPENLAYIMYTSGSTGKPKGVQIQQSGVMRLVKANNFVEITPADRLLQIANYTFDGSTFDIWGALLNGATLVLVTEEEIVSLDVLSKLIAVSGATIAFVPTALFNTIADLNPRVFRGFRKVLVGGERMSPVQSGKVYQETGPGVLINGYGPTETTTFASTYELNEDPTELQSISIGKPIANTMIYILNHRLQPVPVGVAGEIYIGGDGLARGYLNRPELTADRFISNPFKEGTRMYKTGDLAKWKSDGTIEYLGRSDQQVKIRGFRVEPGEIEAVLLRHPIVQEAIIIDRSDERGIRYLVAYVVTSAEVADSMEKTLRQYLQQTLPEYMIPAVFVQMQALPLTPHGKVDRRSLPVPQNAGRSVKQYVAPRTPEEAQMAAIWADVLGMEQVGIRDHFFELGGYSLKAMQILSRVSQEMGMDIPLKLFFTSPTIEEILGVLEVKTPAHQRGIQPQPMRDYYPLSPAQQRIWLIEQMVEHNVAYNIPLALLVNGTFDRNAFEKALTMLVKRHEILRTRFTEIHGEPVQIVDDKCQINLHYVEQCTDFPRNETDERSIKEWVIKEACTPFDLEKPGQFRVVLVNLAEKQHLLIITLHHIISDGWSLLHIMLKEIVQLYKAATVGSLFPLPELEIQYRDYAIYQQQMLQQGQWAEEEVYWLQHLSKNIPVLNLPKDYPNVDISQGNGAIEYLQLAADFTEQLRAVAEREQVTLFMLMVATFSVLLHQLTKETDILIGTPVTGRTSREVEGLLGIFLNTLALRCDLSGNPTFIELLGRIKETVLGAFAHQEYPYEKILDRLSSVHHPDGEHTLSPQGTSSSSRQGLFNVMINYIPDFSSSKRLELGELSMEVVPFTEEAAKFELELYLQELSQGLNLKLTYRKDLFSAGMIRRFLNNLKEMMERIVVDPVIALTQLLVQDTEEQDQLLGNFNDDLWDE